MSIVKHALAYMETAAKLSTLLAQYEASNSKELLKMIDATVDELVDSDLPVHLIEWRLEQQ